jgi:hypothetical protein
MINVPTTAATIVATIEGPGGIPASLRNRGIDRDDVGHGDEGGEPRHRFALKTGAMSLEIEERGDGLERICGHQAERSLSITGILRAQGESKFSLKPLLVVEESEIGFPVDALRRSISSCCNKKTRC